MRQKIKLLRLQEDGYREEEEGEEVERTKKKDDNHYEREYLINNMSFSMDSNCQEVEETGGETEEEEEEGCTKEGEVEEEEEEGEAEEEEEGEEEEEEREEAKAELTSLVSCALKRRHKAMMTSKLPEGAQQIGGGRQQQQQQHQQASEKQRAKQQAINRSRHRKRQKTDLGFGGQDSLANESSTPTGKQQQQQQQKQHQQQENICAACMKPIKERYLLMALDKQWHEDCLKCACCDCRLGEVGSSLFTHSDKILCRRDFLRIFGQHGHCAACKKSIPPYEMVMRANENAYHMDCFACQQCQHRFCVGDRFHLTQTHQIICVLCQAEVVSSPNSAAAATASSNTAVGSNQHQEQANKILPIVGGGGGGQSHSVKQNGAT